MAISNCSSISGHHLRVRTSYVIKRKIAEFVGMENRFLPIVRRPFSEVLGATAYQLVSLRMGGGSLPQEQEPETNNAIKMEVGIEECLHIEFEYNKSKYHLRDVVIGKRTRIQSHTFICEMVTIGEDCFIAQIKVWD